MDVPENDVVQASTSSLPAVDVDDVKFEKLSLKEATSDQKIEFTQEELKIWKWLKHYEKSKSDGGY